MRCCPKVKDSRAECHWERVSERTRLPIPHLPTRVTSIYTDKFALAQFRGKRRQIQKEHLRELCEDEDV
ncbi:hypothetical protein VTL71DRAFT_15948 [Oculimacula yallundae]|uniref:Uncharacterized protein n=1 Tax=Oculimacula yallundae TaxID=86028 RepID=A0ABR4CD31_9HELO